MATILLTLPEGESVTNGKLITFIAPCNCAKASSITIESQAYTLVDALGNNLSTKNAFSQGASVTVAINTTDKKAVLQSSGIAASADSINTVVPVDKGGTGATTAAGARSNLGITPANIGAAPASHTHGAGNINSGTLSSDRLPTIPVAKGGTGATTVAGARTNLGITPANIGAAPASHTHGAGDINSGTLSSDRLPTVPITKGGTGATSAEYARSNLGLTVVYDAMELYDESKGTIEARLSALEAIQAYDGTINIS